LMKKRKIKKRRLKEMVRRGRKMVEPIAIKQNDDGFPLLSGFEAAELCQGERL